MQIKYALSEIRKNGTDHTWWRKRFLTHVASRYFSGIGRPETTPVAEEDWDHLIILDACRFDLFKSVYESDPLPGDINSRTSLQSGTPGFLKENFEGNQFHDVVYVTANPYVDTNLPEETFHDVVSVWRDGWDDDKQTVMPETMARRTLAIADEYPNKRIISHFLQPHAPFVGKVELGQRETFAIRQQAMGDEDVRTRHRTPFELLDAGKVTRDEVWKAYRSNLELAWPAVKQLLSKLSGLIAVTSDHGNAMGERAWPFPIRVYGHPLGVLIPPLTEVPWLVHDNGPRKKVSADPPEAKAKNVNEVTSKRLRMLGYAE